MYGKSRAMRSQQFQVYGGVSVIGVQLIATHYTDTVFVLFFFIYSFLLLKSGEYKEDKNKYFDGNSFEKCICF